MKGFSRILITTVVLLVAIGTVLAMEHEWPPGPPGATAIAAVDDTAQAQVQPAILVNSGPARAPGKRAPQVERRDYVKRDGAGSLRHEKRWRAWCPEMRRV